MQDRGKAAFERAPLARRPCESVKGDTVDADADYHACPSATVSGLAVTNGAFRSGMTLRGMNETESSSTMPDFRIEGVRGNVVMVVYAVGLPAI